MNNRLDIVLQSIPDVDKTTAVVMLARTLAHELNNILTVIVGNLALLDEIAPEDDTMAVTLAYVRDASERGMALSTTLQDFTGRLSHEDSSRRSAQEN